MSWKEPDSIWAKTQRIRATVAGTVFALALLVTIALPVYHLSSAASRDFVLWGSRDPLGAFGVLVIPFVLFAFLSFAAWKQWRKERWILDAVPRYDGRVCPGCRKLLHKLPPVGKCNRCGTEYESLLLQEYWEHYTLDAASAVSILHRMRNRGSEQAENDAKRTGWFAGRLHRWAKVLICSGYLIVCLSAIVIFSKRPVHGVIACILGGAIAAGFILLIGGLPRRVGKTRHCPGCGYQMAPRGTNPIRCPECGVSWSGPGGAAFGRLVQRPAFVFVGFALIVSVAAILLYPGGLSGQNLNRLCPTNQLIARIADTDDYFVNGEWTELNRRSLSTDQERRLAEALLDRRLAGHFGWLKPDPSSWLRARLGTKTLPRDTVDRYYREGILLRVRGPHIVNTGDSITLRFTPSCQQFAFDPYGCPDRVLFFAGYRLGTSSKLTGRLDQAVSVSISRIDSSDPEIHFTAGQPGILEVHLEGWHIVGPPQELNKPITWRTDGTPVIPAAAVWSERFEIKHVMRVDP